MKANLPVYVN
jgi:hypothetical protein